MDEEDYGYNEDDFYGDEYYTEDDYYEDEEDRINDR